MLPRLALSVLRVRLCLIFACVSRSSTCCDCLTDACRGRLAHACCCRYWASRRGFARAEHGSRRPAARWYRCTLNSTHAWRSVILSFLLHTWVAYRRLAVGMSMWEQISGVNGSSPRTELLLELDPHYCCQPGGDSRYCGAYCPPYSHLAADARKNRRCYLIHYVHRHCPVPKFCTGEQAISTALASEAGTTPCVRVTGSCLLATLPGAKETVGIAVALRATTLGGSRHQST